MSCPCGPVRGVAKTSSISGDQETLIELSVSSNTKRLGSGVQPSDLLPFLLCRAPASGPPMGGSTVEEPADCLPRRNPELDVLSSEGKAAVGGWERHCRNRSGVVHRRAFRDSSVTAATRQSQRHPISCHKISSRSPGVMHRGRRFDLSWLPSILSPREPVT